MDQKTVAFARSWARRYVRTKHPHGLDEEDVENRILESLYYNKDKEKALSKALNVLAHNRDDHLKNVGFLMDSTGRWSLAPFYDFTYAAGPNGWHTLSVSGEGANPGEDDLARLAEEVNLDRRDAEGILSAVKDAVAGLRGLTPVGH